VPKRGRMLALIAVVVCALLGVQTWLLLRPAPPSTKITAAAAGRIERGMTTVEVETIIGLPPGDYRSDPATPRHYAELLPKEGGRVLEWEADGCNIQVMVDDQSGRVLSKIVGEPITPVPLMERVRTWLGW
jgi:hypothetical protein